MILQNYPEVCEDFLKEMDAVELADLMIVSGVVITVGDELKVDVVAAKGEKCERCWKNHVKVGTHADHPGLCPRCAKVVAAIDPALLAE